MSYARKGLDGSDVYVFAFNHEGPPVRIVHPGQPAPDDPITGYCCHECSLMPPCTDASGWLRQHFECKRPLAMVAHLFEHIITDEAVPRAAIERLGRESDLIAEHATRLGVLEVSPGANVKLTLPQIEKLFLRHARLDPGDLDARDHAVNLLALSRGNRVLSAYTVGEVKVFVITEAGRERTSLLLRSEY